jgi:threonylcarbamoyladenosine tRNA methylthiotransferase MtaB
MNLFAGKTAALRTLGCKVNVYETDAMRSMLEEAGFRIVPFAPGADVYVINTCSVTNIADRKSRQMIHRARTLNPDAVVVACGCYVQTAVDRTGLDVDADLIIGSSRKKELVQELEKFYTALQEAKEEGGTDALPAECVGDVMHEPSFEEMPLSGVEGHTRAYIKVQDGCNMFCSYCIIPYARGRIRSRKISDILPELEHLAGQGIREIVLTGIHLSSYGVDFGNEEVESFYRGELPAGKGGWQARSRLIDLIEAAAGVPGIERIRLGSLEPTIITEEFARRLSRIMEFCPHFHLSLQSGCDSVLRRMNRHYTTRDYAGRVECLRRYFDNPAITTDVIVGFPGETEEEFEETVKYLEKIRLYETHIFKYSLRAGTRAASMEGQVTEQVKTRRSDILLRLNARNKAAYEKSWDGREAEVLIEEEARRNADGSPALPNVEKLASGRGENGDGEQLLIRMESAGGGTGVYTGYTRQYIRVFVKSDADICGRIVKGKLQVDNLGFLY